MLANMFTSHHWILLKGHLGIFPPMEALRGLLFSFSGDSFTESDLHCFLCLRTGLSEKATLTFMKVFTYFTIVSIVKIEID